MIITQAMLEDEFGDTEILQNGIIKVALSTTESDWYYYVQNDTRHNRCVFMVSKAPDAESLVTACLSSVINLAWIPMEGL